MLCVVFRYSRKILNFFLEKSAKNFSPKLFFSVLIQISMRISRAFIHNKTFHFRYRLSPYFWLTFSSIFFKINPRLDFHLSIYINFLLQQISWIIIRNYFFLFALSSQSLHRHTHWESAQIRRNFAWNWKKIHTRILLIFHFRSSTLTFRSVLVFLSTKLASRVAL